MTHRALTILLLLVFSTSVFSTTAWSQANRSASASTAASPATQGVALAKQLDELSADAVRLEESHARTIKLTEQMSQEYSRLSDKVGALCAAPGGASVQPADVAKALADLCDTSRRYRGVYPKVEVGLQMENRKYTALSNVMKTKHDTAKNSISNVR